MLNYIWFALLAIALVVAMFNGTAAQVTKASVDSAKTAVEISLGLIGIMTLWLGIMRVAEKAGLVTMLARVLHAMARNHGNSYVRFVLAQSRQHRDAIGKLPLAEDTVKRFARLAEESRARQREIEAADTVRFEVYRQKYLDPARLTV